MAKNAIMAGVAAVALAGMAGAAQAQEVKLGALMPLTGGLQAYGEVGVKGVELAVEHANAAGGILDDSEVEVVVGDTQTKPQPAVDAAKKLVSVENVAAVIGALGSSNTISAATSVTSVEGVPQISSASTSPKITTLDDNDFLFRTVASDAYQGIALAKLVSDKGIEKVATTYVNNDYGEGLANAFKSAFEERGGTVTSSQPHEENKSSYRGELSKAAEGGAEHLVLISYPDSGGISIIKQALEEGFFQNFIMTDGMKAPEIVEQIGFDYLEGDFGTVAASPESEGKAAFERLYKERYGQLPAKPYTDTAYDGAMIALLAIQAAGSTDGEAVRDKLRMVATPPGEVILPGEFEKAKKLLAEGKDIDYEGGGGSQNFDENGDVSSLFEHWAIRNGGVETVEIFDPTM